MLGDDFEGEAFLLAQGAQVVDLRDRSWACEVGVHLVGDVAFQAPHSLTCALVPASVDVVLCAFLVAHANEDDLVQSGVGLPITSTVETVSLRLA